MFGTVKVWLSCPSAKVNSPETAHGHVKVIDSPGFYQNK
jgi:hypothetical protein